MLTPLALLLLLATSTPAPIPTPTVTAPERGTVLSTDTLPAQDTNPVVCTWQFQAGDPPAYTGCGTTPPVRWYQAGIYTATLTVCWQNAPSVCSSLDRQIEVLASTTTIVSAEVIPSLTYVGQPVDLLALASGPPPLTYTWTIPGRGTYSGAVVTLDTTGWPATVYPVNLTVSSAASSASWSGSLILQTAPPVVFSARCPGMTCMFSTGDWVSFAHSTTVMPTRWEYDWNGDGTFDQVATAPVTAHQYDLENWLFYPRLRVTYGGTQTYTFTHVLPMSVLNPYGLVFRDGFEAGSLARWSAKRP